jgi:hypothetical protein
MVHLQTTCHGVYTPSRKKRGTISRMEFQIKLIGNLISKSHRTEERPLGEPPETVPPSRMNAPY